MTLFIACYVEDREKLYFFIQDPNPNTRHDIKYSDLSPNTKKTLDEAKYISYKKIPSVSFDHIVFVWYD